MKEIWKKIEGYNDIYSISSWGRVKRIECLIKQNHPKQKYRLIKERFLIPVNVRGYSRVTLSNKKHTNYSIHRLVATAFLNNRNNKKEINHIDGDKSNNKVQNLEWCTRKENSLHAVKNNLINPPIGHKHWNSKLKEKDIILIRKINPIKHRDQENIANKFHVHVNTIRSVLFNKTWRHLL